MNRAKKVYDSDGTTLETLDQPGGLSRAELERSAKNVLNYILNYKM